MRKLAWPGICLVMAVCLFTGTRGVSAHDDDREWERRCSPPPAGLTRWSPGDSNTNDIIGGRNAVLHGDATIGRGFVHQAFRLDGDGDFVDVADDPALNDGNITLFLNGVPVAEGTSSLNLNSTSSLKFGHRGDPFDTPGSKDDRGFFLNARIDEVELFVGRALTQEEVQGIFNA